nr:TrmB family transcriptional regulator [Lachnospiraceae bacterium]
MKEIAEKITEELLLFGLTRQEAAIYVCLYRSGALNGYEVAKLTGISRSNVYNALAGLVEKGAAYRMEAASNKYVAVPVEEMCDNHLRRITEAKQHLSRSLVRCREENDGYITIEGYKHIRDKMNTMLDKVELRLYLSIPSCYIAQYLPKLEALSAEHKKVVLLTDKPVECSDTIQMYISEPKEKQIHLIVDSKYVLTGDYSENDSDTCLYSGQKNFVNVLKEALRNEIRLTQLGVNKTEEE